MLVFATALTVSASPEAVKLRSLELKEVTVSMTIQSSDGSVKATQVTVKYSDLLRQVLLTPPQNGNSSDDQVKMIEVWLPIKKVIDEKGHRLLLSDVDYQFLVSRLNGFRWGGVPDMQETVAGFISYIRGLKEEEFPIEGKK
jgi:hypothetical protein